MGKPILMLCIATVMWACGGPKVVGNTYTGLGPYSIEVASDFSYVGEVVYYRDY